MTTIPVTVVVPVKNEEANLSECLNRLARFNRVVVVDSESSDRTRAIALEQGADVIEFRWNGQYPKKRNWLLINHPPSTDWVLFLDADEFVDDRFCDAVATATASQRYDGYWLNYTNYFLGRRLRYGVPQRKLALFRVGKALYERIDEDAWSKLDMEIHEHPIIEGAVGEIEDPIDHNDFRGIEKFIDRHRDYALWEANRVLRLQRSGAENWSRLTDRQNFKYRHLAKWWYPWFYLLYAYVIRGGFRDGAAGLYYAFYKAWYFLTIRLKIYELRREGRRIR
ncbi:MAG: glycosyltransferase family 2 protein [Hyphomicrobiaceae bacterium]|nr:glycosyltransferase family 2 protein [Hyphomicrobiaceae bacterium]